MTIQICHIYSRRLRNQRTVQSFALLDRIGLIIIILIYY